MHRSLSNLVCVNLVYFISNQVHRVDHFIDGGLGFAYLIAESQVRYMFEGPSSSSLIAAVVYNDEGTIVQLLGFVLREQWLEMVGSLLGSL
jgi:hypothetical protein